MGSHAKVDEEVEVHRTRTSVIREKFALFDINNDGVLTKEEIMHILTRPTANGARTFNTKMLNEFFLFLKFDEVDKDGNGVLSIDEFIDALLPKEARVVFNEFDKERQGKVHELSASRGRGMAEAGRRGRGKQQQSCFEQLAASSARGLRGRAAAFEPTHCTHHCHRHPCSGRGR